MSFDSEGKALGVSGKQIKKAMMLFWILRYQREQLEYYTLQESCVWNLIRQANATVLQNGLPTGLDHVCSNVGAVHLKDVNGVCVVVCILFITFLQSYLFRLHTPKMQHKSLPSKARRWTPPQTARILRQYDSILVFDGHQKVHRRVCQHDPAGGRRVVDAETGLNVPSPDVCQETYRRGSPFCSAHGGDGVQDSEEEGEIEVPSPDTVEVLTVESEEGCKKEFHQTKNHRQPSLSWSLNPIVAPSHLFNVMVFFSNRWVTIVCVCVCFFVKE